MIFKKELGFLPALELHPHPFLGPSVSNRRHPRGMLREAGCSRVSCWPPSSTIVPFILFSVHRVSEHRAPLEVCYKQRPTLRMACLTTDNFPISLAKCLLF
mmetsp:Transcript_15414/g.33752  ORF Transcript_15414/g.33752 Transcript_15414/m.33752 type:complete len:101 (-) Transcript_15414:198-500(-)